MLSESNVKPNPFNLEQNPRRVRSLQHCNVQISSWNRSKGL